MARRLGTAPTPTAIPTPAPSQYVSTRTKGLQLIAGLQPVSLERVQSIDTPEGYLQMDARLAQIRNAKAQWALALEPISGPLERAISKQKEALAEAKKAAEGVRQLDSEVSKKLDDLEARVKLLMKNYKELEARRIREAEDEKQKEAKRLQDEATKRAIQAASAKSPQMRARLEQQRADLEAKAQQVSNEAEVVAAPVKGASSVTRTQQKVRVKDPIAFLHAIEDYEPVAGVYEIGKPPLRTIDKKGVEAFLAEVVSARLNDLFREQPGVVASWAGVEVYDDITIAGR